MYIARGSILRFQRDAEKGLQKLCPDLQIWFKNNLFYFRKGERFMHLGKVILREFEARPQNVKEVKIRKWFRSYRIREIVVIS